MKKNRGFTLIELLVVIAIIGILSSVVLASLNSARTKAKDSSAMSSMAQARAAAELSYSSNTSSYASMCPTITNFAVGAAGTNGAELRAALYNAQTAIGNTAFATQAVAGAVTCGSTASDYAVSIRLNSGGSYCIDSTGFAGMKTNTQTAGETVCA